MKYEVRVYIYLKTPCFLFFLVKNNQEPTNNKQLAIGGGTGRISLSCVHRKYFVLLYLPAFNRDKAMLIVRRNSNRYTISSTGMDWSKYDTLLN